MKKEHFIHPPDFQKSLSHRLATRIFKGLERDEDGQQCECCGRRVGITRLGSKCCYSDMQLSHLGPGLPLFFCFIKLSIGLLSMLCLIFCIFAAVTNFVGKDCTQQASCDSNLLNILSIVNKTSQYDYLSGQNYFLLGFVVFFFWFVVFAHFIMRKIILKCDERINSPSDYAVILSRLPPLTTEADILAMVDMKRQELTQEQKIRTQNLKVIKVIMGYHMGQYIRTATKNKQLFRLSIQRGTPFISTPLPALTEPGSIAILVFAQQASKYLFLCKPTPLQKIGFCLCDPCTPLTSHRVQGHRIAIDRAPEPDDITWENTNISMHGAILRKVLYNGLCVGVLVAGGVAQYVLAVLQNKYSDNERTVFFIGIFASVMVAVMNEIIYRFLLFTAARERKQTTTQTNINLIIKMGLFLFLNAGVFMVAAKILARVHDFKLQSTLSVEVTQIMILNAVTPHLSLLVTDYLQLPGVLFQWAVRKSLIFSTQMSANTIFEKPLPQISYKYGYLIRTLWLTALYCPLAPIVAPISVLALAVNLNLEKCLHSGAYRAPNMVSSRQNETAMELVMFFPVIMSCGELLIFLYFYSFHIEKLPNYWAIPIYVSLALSTAYLFMPMKLISKKIFKIQAESYQAISYEEAESNFEVTYEMVNPGYVCLRRRKRDKVILQQIFGKIEQMVTLESPSSIQQHLLASQARGGYDNDPISFLLNNSNILQAFNSNYDY